MKVIKTPKLAQMESELDPVIDTAVMVVVNQQGQFLILKRGASAPWMPNKWNLPGGGVEEGEDWAEAAARECSEEAGFYPSNVRPIGTFENIAAFMGSYSGDVRINFESSDSAWITPNEIEQYDFVHPVASILSKVI
jgi:8-oxo-dGTP pyrophosphatase MutT (NUDIX family)